jgi:thiol-disulfide isomerase/thioredoxin
MMISSKAALQAGNQKRRVGARWRLLIVVAVALLSLACQSAPPPRPASATDAAGSMISTKARRERAERLIQLVSDLAMPKPDGTTFKLADLRGKVVLVDVWATWCGPCIKQMPQLAELNARYRERGLEVVGLSLNNPKEHQAEVEMFVKKTGVNYIIAYADRRISDAFLRGTEDETGAAPIPQLFLLSRDGRLVEHFIGDDPARGLAPLEKAINQQLSIAETPQ